VYHTLAASNNKILSL